MGKIHVQGERRCDLPESAKIAVPSISILSALSGYAHIVVGAGTIWVCETGCLVEVPHCEHGITEVHD